jgi:hypothetical protein
VWDKRRTAQTNSETESKPVDRRNKVTLKAEINPVNKEIGIRTFKSLKNGNFLIEQIVRKRD